MLGLQLSLGHQTPCIHKVPESRTLGWGPRTGSVLQAGNYQPGGIWFGPLPAPTPTLCLGRAERLLVPVSISEFAVGGGAPPVPGLSRAA